MEKFRTTLKKRLKLACLYNVVVLILIALGYFLGRRFDASALIVGFDIGFCIGLQFVMIYCMRQYHAALKNDTKLQALYIAENDERNRFIESQIGDTGINIILSGLALGTVVTGFLNRTVFFTLLCAMLFSTMVKFALKVYYNKKV
jgi:hypothetical protein